MRDPFEQPDDETSSLGTYKRGLYRRPSEGQAPVSDDAIPVSIDDVPTAKVVTPTEEEMADRMERRRAGVRG